MQLVESALELVGTVVVAGGGLSFIVYQAFKHMAAKWLDARFEERLQDLRHKHEQEIEHLRFRINALLDRTTKLNEREFEVLPEAWSKLHAAFWEASSLVSSLKSYPDLEQMHQAQLDEFLSKCPLLTWQVDEIRSAIRKNECYQEHIYWHRLSETSTQVREANVFLAKVGIFMLPEIRDRFTELATMAFQAVTEDRFNHEHKPRPMLREHTERLAKDGQAKLMELERVVHSRLWPSDRAAV